jgi:2,3-bisphosphoglycerate-independent phosphoglycerate mutase
MFSFFSKQCSIKPVVLVVLDGFGVAPPSKGNAIFLAKTPNYDRFLKTYPNTTLIASGESVGLPANEVGNTEVGHLTIGAGRVIYQDLKRISMAMATGEINQNEALLAAVNRVRTHQSKLHIMGLVSSGNVHSSLEHLYGLLDFCKAQGMTNLFIHAFTDGRDSHPESGAKVVGQLEEALSQRGVGKIASVMGRYYAMDRDRRWDRIEQAYNALVLGQGEQGVKVVEVLENNYKNGITDEFIKPTLITENNTPVATIGDNDAVIFFNFRVDRPKQLTTALVLPEFESFKSFGAGFDEQGKPVESEKVEFESTFTRQKIVQNLFMVTMTEYHENLPVQGVAFRKQRVDDALPAVLTWNKLKHLHMAESEKERFVTYYFNGMREEELEGSGVVIVPSPRVATYDKKPEMSVYTLVKAFEKQLNKCEYHFAVLNFANPDMVAHTGNLQATVRAVEHVDKALGKMEQLVLKAGGTLLITADHGNAEELLTFSQSGFFYTSEAGGMNTEHSDKPVPLIIINEAFKGNVPPIRSGSLSDVAPTILALMGLEMAEGMTGKSLL